MIKNIILTIIFCCLFINIDATSFFQNYNKNNLIINNSNILQPTTPRSLSEEEKKYVAHAGGQIEDYTYLNNLESIRNSYNKGVRLIELDVELTTDNVPIMLHSWDGFITKFFGVEAWKKYSSEEFNNFQMVNEWHKLTLDDTIKYMEEEFKEMYLITDTKNDNIFLLNTLVSKYPHMMYRIIPQVYNQEEYKYAKDLGFENIIYTLYMSEDTQEEIIEFCKQNNPFAITMNTYWAYTNLPAELAKLDIYTYAHTINTVQEFETLKNKGINGVYTDNLFEY